MRRNIPNITAKRRGLRRDLGDRQDDGATLFQFCETVVTSLDSLAASAYWTLFFVPKLFPVLRSQFINYSGYTLSNLGGQKLGENMPTEPVLPEAELRAKVVQRIEDGRLPCAIATHIDAGYGTRAMCNVCDQPIAPDKIEYDVTAPESGRRMHFHFACHAAWQRECALRLKDSRRP